MAVRWSGLRAAGRSAAGHQVRQGSPRDRGPSREISVLCVDQEPDFFIFDNTIAKTKTPTPMIRSVVLIFRVEFAVWNDVMLLVESDGECQL